MSIKNLIHQNFDLISENLLTEKITSQAGRFNKKFLMKKSDKLQIDDIFVESLIK